jgi:hypothetical protein
MPPERYASIVDVHVILPRGGKILLLRRAGTPWRRRGPTDGGYTWAV